MDSKLKYLRLEDNTVSMICDKAVIGCLDKVLPSQWLDIFLSRDKEEKRKKTITLWEDHLGEVLPGVTKILRDRLEDIDLIQKDFKYTKGYYILYTINDGEDRKISTCAVRFYNYTTKLGAQIQ